MLNANIIILVLIYLIFNLFEFIIEINYLFIVECFSLYFDVKVYRSLFIIELIAILIRFLSKSVKLEPDGKQRPSSNKDSATTPP